MNNHIPEGFLGKKQRLILHYHILLQNLEHAYTESSFESADPFPTSASSPTFPELKHASGSWHKADTTTSSYQLPWFLPQTVLSQNTL